MNKYAIVIEKAEQNFSAYVPDVPGCIATGKTVEETRQLLMDALASHLELLREAGNSIAARFESKLLRGDALGPKRERHRRKFLWRSHHNVLPFDPFKCRSQAGKLQLAFEDFSPGLLH